MPRRTVGWLPETRRPAGAAEEPGGAGGVYSRLLRHLVFLRGVVCGGLAQAGMFAYIAGSPFVFIELHHVLASAYGWLFGANASGLIGASQLNRHLLARLPAHRLLGAIQFGLAAIAGTAVGWRSDGTALPMAIVIAVCGVASLTGYLFLLRHGGNLKSS